MNKRKILSLAMALSIVAILAVGATLAYFTDTDEATNVFTVGDVDIQLLESQYHRQNDDATDEMIFEDATTKYADYLAKEGENMVPGRWVRKAPYVKNIGDNAAYVRVKVAIPTPLMKACSFMLYTTGFTAGEMAQGSSVDKDGITTTTFYFTKALQPGATTYYAPIWQFKIDDNETQDTLAGMGVQTDLSQTIVVTAEAIQAEGFADYVAAFAAFDAQ